MRTGGTQFRKNKKRNARLNEHTRNKTSKFIFKTDFDMTAIQKEKSDICPCQNSIRSNQEMRERAYPICNFIQVNKNVKNVTNFL